MCGRFTLRTSAAEWSQLFFAGMQHDLSTFARRPRYNIAPTQAVACVLGESGGQPSGLHELRWGLVPGWAKDPSIGSRMINARSETAETKPSFRNAFASRRCLVPADGFYEWKKVDDGKQPFLMEASSGGVFAMAGLWEENRRINEDGPPLRTFTILTTAANEFMQPLHDRMPVLLDPVDFQRWLDPNFRDVGELKQLCEPAPEGLLQMTKVSRHVNNPRHDDLECVVPAAD